jgi:nucleotide-binding universal stress UspA family protein
MLHLHSSFDASAMRRLDATCRALRATPSSPALQACFTPFQGEPRTACLRVALALNVPRAMLIAHATDLSGHDRAAFEHAAALSLAMRARLVTVHAGEELGTPPADELAARWGQTIQHQLLRVSAGDDPADTVTEVLRELAPALTVVGTHARHGVSAIVHASVAEAIARNFDRPVLVVPNAASGFVDATSGSVGLRRIIVPAGTTVEAASGVEAARGLAALLGIAAPDLELVHAGIAEPQLSKLGIEVVQLQQPLERAIVERARATGACLIVMSTRGHDGVLDVLRGSHTERVIRDAPCPVLSVPITHRLRA